ncbi:MAG: GDYXXLXY domain-containing protein [Planctomycetota bacterium]
MKIKSIKFWAIVLLEVLFLLGIFVRYRYALANGVSVLLKVMPVDPRDLLRGDYVILSYEISSINLSKIENKAGNLSCWDTVYVRLERGEKFWNAVAIDKSFHTTNNSEVWLKGRVITSDYTLRATHSASGAKDSLIGIDYGIEEFFVPEGEGRMIERERNNKNVSIEIRVTKSGLGLIKQIYVNDQPVDFRQIR